MTRFWPRETRHSICPSQTSRSCHDHPSLLTPTRSSPVIPARRPCLIQSPIILASGRRPATMFSSIPLPRHSERHEESHHPPESASPGVPLPGPSFQGWTPGLPVAEFFPRFPFPLPPGSCHGLRGVVEGAAAACGLGLGQVMPPRLRFGAGERGGEAPIDGVVREDGAAGLPRPSLGSGVQPCWSWARTSVRHAASRSRRLPRHLRA